MGWETYYVLYLHIESLWKCLESETRTEAQELENSCCYIVIQFELAHLAAPKLMMSQQVTALNADRIYLLWHHQLGPQAKLAVGIWSRDKMCLIFQKLSRSTWFPDPCRRNTFYSVALCNHMSVKPRRITAVTVNNRPALMLLIWVCGAAAAGKESP